MTKSKIFVLGDSRTGTTSLHHFLLEAGFKAIHYFVADLGLKEPLHENYDYNWPLFSKFIETREYEAFSDYPTRVFFRDLVSQYPSAFFVLSVRKDLPTWRTSMLSYFGAQIDIEFLTRYYLNWNQEIRELCVNFRFMELCIDDPPATNSVKLGEFLNLEVVPGLLHLNRSAFKPSSASYENKTIRVENVATVARP